MEDGIIYTLGDIDTLRVIFDGLSLMFDPSETTFFSGNDGLGLGVATTLAAMIALIGTMNQYITQQRLQMQGPLMGLFIYAIVAVPTVDRMYISDINTGKTLPVYNVPLGLGVLGYGMSLISYQTSQLMDTAFETVPIEGTAFESTLTGGSGFLSPIKTLYALRSSAVFDLDEALIYNMYSYSRYCLHKAASEDATSGLPDVNFSSDRFKTVADPFGYMMDVEFISPNHLGAYAEFMDPATGRESLQTCADVRTILAADETVQGSLAYYLDSSPKFAGGLLRALVSDNDNKMQVCADGGTCVTPADAITTAEESASQLLGGVTLAKQYFQLRVMHDFNTLISSSREMDPDSAVMAINNINEAIQTAQLQEALEGSTFLNFMIPAINFIISLFYALFPLAMLIMITKGMKAAEYLAGYLLIGIWGYSIFPVATAINYITIANTREAIAALINMDGYTIYGYDMMVESVSNYLSVGSNMLAAAPIVTLAVITGSVFALTSVASSAAAPEGAAAGVAQRSTPQSHSQITQMGLTPQYSDIRGDSKLSAVSAASTAVAQGFTVSTSVSNAATQKMTEGSVETRMENVQSANSKAISSLRTSANLVQTGGGTSSDVNLVNGYQRVGENVLKNSNMDYSGWSEQQIKGHEIATGYLASINGSAGIEISTGKLVSELIEGMTGRTPTESEVQSTIQSVQNPQGTSNPSAMPGDSSNPGDNTGKRNPAGKPNLGFFLSGGVAGQSYDGNRKTDQTSNSSEDGGSSSTEAGGGVTTTTSDGSVATNGRNVSLTREQQEAISQNLEGVTTASQAYEHETERHDKYEDMQQKARELDQQHNFNLEDAYIAGGFTSPQTVNDYYDSQIESLGSQDFPKEQIAQIKNDFYGNSLEERNKRMAGANDGLAHLASGAYAADSTAFQYSSYANNGGNDLFTADQARTVQNLMSNMDTKLFEPLLGKDTNDLLAKVDKGIANGEQVKAKAEEVVATTDTETGKVKPSSLGANISSPQSNINSTLDSIRSQGQASASFADNIRGYFSPQELDAATSRNAEQLGVRSDTKFEDLNSRQQNQVLAEQMKGALEHAPKQAGIKDEDYQAVRQFDGNSGIGQNNDRENRAAINHGQNVLRALSDTFNGDVSASRTSIKETQGQIQTASDAIASDNNSNSAHNTDARFLSRMSEMVPNSAGDTSGNPDAIGGVNHNAPLEDRQKAWNSRLQTALAEQVSSGNITQGAAERMLTGNSIEVGSNVTPTQAFAGMVANNVSGSYAVPETKTDGLVDAMTSDSSPGVKATVQDAFTKTYDGTNTVMGTLNHQRMEMNLNDQQTAQYLQGVRDNLENMGADMSGYSASDISTFMNGRDYSVGGYSYNAVNHTPTPAEVNNFVTEMVNRVPSNSSGRDVAAAVQQPMIDMKKN